MEGGVVCFCCCAAGSYYDIEAFDDLEAVAGGSQAALDLVADDGASDHFAGYEPEPRLRSSVGADADDEETATFDFSGAIRGREVCTTAQATISPHSAHLPLSPDGLLDDDETHAALEAAGTEHVPATGGGHAVEKAVATAAGDDFWLVCALGHGGHLTTTTRALSGLGRGAV